MIETTKNDKEGSSQIPSHLVQNIDNEAAAPSRAIFVLGLYLLFVFVALVFLLVKIWPTAPPEIIASNLNKESAANIKL